MDVGGLDDTREPATTADREPARVQRMRAGSLEALARRSDDVHEELYLFAGRAVRLRVIGRGFAARTHRAFAHLRCPGRAAEPMLTIDLWDEAETAIAGLRDAETTDLDRSWVACDGMLSASADGRYASFRYQDSVLLLDRHSQHMIGCRRNGAHLTGGEYSKPLLLMLSIWYHDRGVQLLHTGLIAAGGRGVLLPGESGAGKSTTSLSGLLQGLEFLGDDFVGLERSPGGGFVGHSLFSTACVVRENLGRFPELRARAVDDGDAGEDKPILFLSEIFPERIRPTVPIAAIALLQIGHSRTRIRRARRPEALHQFAASTLHAVVPRPGRDALLKIGELVENAPAWWVELGPDLRDIPGVIERIVADADSSHGL